MITKVKTDSEIQAMRESGRMLAQVLSLLESSVTGGMATKDLSEIAKSELRKLGGQPTFLGYQGFPDVICISVNDEVVHGIPSPTHFIRNGDLIGLDFGVTYQNMITDSAITVGVGQLEPKAQQLLETTRAALNSGIDVVKNGVRIGDISEAVETVLNSKQYGVVRDLVGHGVGHQLHEEPNIPNYGQKGTGQSLKTNMTIAIEPMATLGDFNIRLDPDGWTIRTADGSLSAHFEHTILVTEQGSEILTELP